MALHVEIDAAGRDGDPGDGGAHEVTMGRQGRRLGHALAIGALGALVIGAIVSGGRPDRGAPATTTTPGAGLPGRGSLLDRPTGLAILAASDGRIVRIDLDDGTVVSAPADLAGRAYLVRTLRGVLTVSFERGSVLFPDDGAAPVRLGLGTPNYLGEGPRGRLWFADYAASADTSVRYVDTDRLAPAVTVDTAGLQGRLVGDGAAGLLAEAAGRTVRLRGRAGAPEPVAVGSPVAAANGFVVERICDDAAPCRLAVLDTRIGTARMLPATGGNDEAGFGILVSPDGRWIVTARLVSAGNDRIRAQRTLVGVDGTVVDLGPTDSPCLGSGCEDSPSWAADGSILVGTRTGGELWVWQPGLSLPQTLTLTLPTGVTLVQASLAVVPRAMSLPATPTP